MMRNTSAALAGAVFICAGVGTLVAGTIQAFDRKIGDVSDAIENVARSSAQLILTNLAVTIGCVVVGLFLMPFLRVEDHHDARQEPNEKESKTNA